LSYKRRIKLIQPRLQLKLTLAFTLMGCTAAAFQLLVTNVTVLNLAERVSSEGTAALDHLPRLLLANLVSTLMVYVPLTICIGILLTHRIAGPIFRFERYLEGVARGESLEPCQIRKGDMLQELCERINSAVSALREAAAENEQDEVAAVTAEQEPAESVSRAA
jgi:nitrogen fixation/metabolism regulation signal transduction histidine kinase